MQPTSSEQPQSMSKIRELRDEIRVQIHLAGMEAKKRWEELEKRIQELERKEAMKPTAAHELLTALEKFRHSFRT